jgi:hypothetical protein
MQGSRTRDISVLPLAAGLRRGIYYCCRRIRLAEISSRHPTNRNSRKVAIGAAGARDKLVRFRNFVFRFQIAIARGYRKNLTAIRPQASDM